jgi:hypothetical protein
MSVFGVEGSAAWEGSAPVSNAPPKAEPFHFINRQLWPGGIIKTGKHSFNRAWCRGSQP